MTFPALLNRGSCGYETGFKPKLIKLHDWKILVRRWKRIWWFRNSLVNAGITMANMQHNTVDLWFSWWRQVEIGPGRPLTWGLSRCCFSIRHLGASDSLKLHGRQCHSRKPSRQDSIELLRILQGLAIVSPKVHQIDSSRFQIRELAIQRHCQRHGRGTLIPHPLGLGRGSIQLSMFIFRLSLAGEASSSARSAPCCPAVVRTNQATCTMEPWVLRDPDIIVWALGSGLSS